MTNPHRPPDDLDYLSASELALLVRRREVSPVELVEHTLGRIEAHNGQLNAYLTVCAEHARYAARFAEQEVMSGRNELGPLHGVPFSVKDLLETAGVRTTYGSRLHETNVPYVDALAVTRLRLAGAILVGKTNTSEFGMLGETRNLLAPDCRNPWDLARTTEGSSGGAAAAVAAGLGPFAVGTDGVGSIIAPSAVCGVVGFKPTTGRVPMWPTPPSSRLFVTVGPIARTVADAKLALEVMSGPDRRDPISLRDPMPWWREADDIPPPRVAWTPDLGQFAVDNEVVASCELALGVLAELGWCVDSAHPAIPSPWPTYGPLFRADAWLELGEAAEATPELFDPEALSELLPARHVSTGEVITALNRLTELRRTIDDFFLDYDVLAMPATATTAFPIGLPPTVIGGRRVEPGWTTYMPFTAAWNMGDNPAVTIPCPPTAGGLPVGLLLVARVGREDLVLRTARALEEALPWAHRRPDLEPAPVDRRTLDRLI
ncbi:amidase [Nocardia sp. NPDC059239]|uniref:amidase n=1 Tax=unclassified Nocardia TaxID=2637762 RepID=UPI0036838372